MKLDESQLLNWCHMIKEANAPKWERIYYVSALAHACDQIDALRKVVEAARRLIDASDPRRYGDLSPAEKSLSEAIEDLDK